jgi:hypothetical protein
MAQLQASIPEWAQQGRWGYNEGIQTIGIVWREPELRSSFSDVLIYVFKHIPHWQLFVDLKDLIQTTRIPSHLWGLPGEHYPKFDPDSAGQKHSRHQMYRFLLDLEVPITGPYHSLVRELCEIETNAHRLAKLVIP